MQRVAIINSRQSLRPTGASSWVTATALAVKTLGAEKNHVFLSSLGETTYELTLNLLGATNSQIEIVATREQFEKYTVNEKTLADYLTTEFRLSAGQARLMCVDIEDSATENDSHTRDINLLNRADIVVPISIRPDGFWSKLLADNPKRIDNRFAVSYQKDPTSIKHEYAKRQLNHKTESRLEGHLIHWTRTTSHPWPGEIRHEFYEALIGAQESYPRSASATLERMLSEKCIRSSSRHMPNGAPMVSLTSASLRESVALMKYRTRYREMTIEPYAIAIPLDAAKRLGAFQVAYHSRGELAQLPPQEKLFAHSRGSNESNWEKEREWRIQGDADLAPVWNQLLVLTENQKTAKKIETDFGIETVAVFE